MTGRRDEPASHKSLQGILGLDGGQPGDRPAVARNDNVGALLDPFEMLAEAIMELPNPDLVIPTM